MTYNEYREKRQAEFSALPIFYAFGDEQFKKAMEERGLTENDTDKIYSFGIGGGYYLRSDADKIRKYFSKPNELLQLMENPEFAEDAFLYEMKNHEYGINWQADWDVCGCFGSCEYGEEKGYVSYLTEMGYSEKVIQSYRNARIKYNKWIEKNDIY